jgi:hypothetical protein
VTACPKSTSGVVSRAASHRGSATLAAVAVAAVLISAAVLAAHTDGHATTPAASRDFQHVAPQGISANGAAMTIWLIPDADYAKLPHPASMGTLDLAQIVTTNNGPASTHLLTLLTNAGLGKLLPGAPTPILEDTKSPRAPVSGDVTYEFANGSMFSATQQQMIHAYPYSVVGLNDGAQLTKRPTGSQLVSHPGDFANQVFLISSSGLMTVLTVFGVQGANVAPPLTVDQLFTLAAALDS